MAYDNGYPPKYSFANVTVSIDDVNDSAPKCAENFHKVWRIRIARIFQCSKFRELKNFLYYLIFYIFYIIDSSILSCFIS